MTIIRQLLIASYVLTASLTQAVSLKTFDNSTLTPYINLAQEILDTTIAAPKQLMHTQKKALKIILKDLKLAAKDEKGTKIKTSRQLYKAFKNNVYRNWKKTQSLPIIQEEQLIGA